MNVLRSIRSIIWTFQNTGVKILLFWHQVSQWRWVGFRVSLVFRLSPELRPGGLKCPVTKKVIYYSSGSKNTKDTYPLSPCDTSYDRIFGDSVRWGGVRPLTGPLSIRFTYRRKVDDLVGSLWSNGSRKEEMSTTAGLNPSERPSDRDRTEKGEEEDKGSEGFTLCWHEIREKRGNGWTGPRGSTEEWNSFTKTKRDPHQIRKRGKNV